MMSHPVIAHKVENILFRYFH